MKSSEHKRIAPDGSLLRRTTKHCFWNVTAFTEVDQCVTLLTSVIINHTADYYGF
jgi:hypothetical protein